MKKFIILFLTLLYVDCAHAVGDALPSAPTIEFAPQTMPKTTPTTMAAKKLAQLNERYVNEHSDPKPLLQSYLSNIPTPAQIYASIPTPQQMYNSVKMPFQFSNQQQKIRALRFWIRVLYWNLGPLVVWGAQKYEKSKMAELLANMTAEQLTSLSQEQLDLIGQVYPEYGKLKMLDQLVNMTDEQLMGLSEEQLALIGKVIPNFMLNDADADVVADMIAR
jgi:hypothetical protein